MYRGDNYNHNNIHYQHHHKGYALTYNHQNQQVSLPVTTITATPPTCSTVTPGPKETSASNSNYSHTHSHTHSHTQPQPQPHSKRPLPQSQLHLDLPLLDDGVGGQCQGENTNVQKTHQWPLQPQSQSQSKSQLQPRIQSRTPSQSQSQLQSLPKLNLNNFVESHETLQEYDHETAYEICQGAAALYFMSAGMQVGNGHGNGNGRGSGDAHGTDIENKIDKTNSAIASANVSDLEEESSDENDIDNASEDIATHARGDNNSGSSSSSISQKNRKLNRKRKRKHSGNQMVDGGENEHGNECGGTLSFVAKGGDGSGRGRRHERRRRHQKLPKRLALPSDIDKVNSLHCFVRSHLLELFTVKGQGEGNGEHVESSDSESESESESSDSDSDIDCSNKDLLDANEEGADVDTDVDIGSRGGTRERTANVRSSSRRKSHRSTLISPSNNYGTCIKTNTDITNPLMVSTSNGKDVSNSTRLFPGRVGLRCSFCSNIHQGEQQTMAAFHPKRLRDLYRSVCTWQRVHFKECVHVPEGLREKYQFLKDSDKKRGKTAYWVESARHIGLMDVEGWHGKGGVSFQPCARF